MDWITDPQSLLALITLTALEIVLGIDNIIFISILTGKLPEHQQPKARLIGLSLAMITRILLLFSLTLIMTGIGGTGLLICALHLPALGRVLSSGPIANRPSIRSPRMTASSGVSRIATCPAWPSVTPQNAMQMPWPP